MKVLLRPNQRDRENFYVALLCQVDDNKIENKLFSFKEKEVGYKMEQFIKKAYYIDAYRFAMK